VLQVLLLLLKVKQGRKDKAGHFIQTAAGAKHFSKICFLKPNGAENFFKRKFFALRPILPNFRPKRSYPRDFSTV